MNKTLWTVLVVILVIATAGAYMFPKGNTIVERLGAQPTSVLEDNCLTVEGVLTCTTVTGFNVASTTLCSIKSPSATSTLAAQGGRLTVASTSATATYMEWGRATTQAATTTTLGITLWAAGAKVSTTTPLNTLSNVNHTFPPNTYLVAKVANAAFAQLGGKCSGTFEVQP